MRCCLLSLSGRRGPTRYIRSPIPSNLRYNHHLHGIIIIIGFRNWILPRGTQARRTGRAAPHRTGTSHRYMRAAPRTSDHGRPAPQTKQSLTHCCDLSGDRAQQPPTRHTRWRQGALDTLPFDRLRTSIDLHGLRLHAHAKTGAWSAIYTNCPQRSTYYNGCLQRKYRVRVRCASLSPSHLRPRQ